jgi:intraflagellar transport protein 56
VLLHDLPFVGGASEFVFCSAPLPAHPCSQGKGAGVFFCQCCCVLGSTPPGGARSRALCLFFRQVGASASECDTIPGRQCMASCFFLLKQFEDVNIYMSSVKAYMYNDDDFNWNFGISQVGGVLLVHRCLCACQAPMLQTAKWGMQPCGVRGVFFHLCPCPTPAMQASVGSYKEAEETLLLVQNETYQSDPCYLSWLARCYVMNGKARQAWELYLKMDTSTDSFNLLQV